MVVSEDPCRAARASRAARRPSRWASSRRGRRPWTPAPGRGRPEEAATATRNSDLALANLVRESHWLARWHERFGTVGEALIALDEALRLDPENAEALADRERLAALE